MHLRPLLIVALATACITKDPTSLRPIDTDVAEISWSVDVVMAATTTAGEPVAHVATLTSSDGNVADVNWTVSSNLEPAMQITTTDLTATVAGAHTVHFETEFNGSTWTADMPLEVNPGAVDRLQLTLDDYTIAAGEQTTLTVQAFDRWDNPTSAEDATVTADAAVTIQGTQVSATIAERYEISAAMDGFTDTASLIVVPGPPTEIEFSLSDDTPGPGQRVDGIVVLTDAYGNETSDPWTLRVEGPPGADIQGGSVTLHEEGTYTVHADVDGTDITASVGPFVVDGRPPELVITNPPRGEHYIRSPNVTGTATDTTGVQSVTVNGSYVSVAGDGSFSHARVSSEGITILETIATDVLDQSTVDKRAYLYGDLQTSDVVDDALLVRIEEGSGGLGMLETLGEDIIAAQDLDALIPNPLYDVLEESCVTIFWTVCVDWYGITLVVDPPTWSSTDLDIDPRSDGTIVATVHVRDLFIDWFADAVVTEIDVTYDGYVAADDLTVSLTVRPRVVGDQVVIDLVSVDSAASGFYIDVDSWIQDVLEWFGYDMSADILGFVLPELENIVEDEVPPLLADLLTDLAVETSFDLIGTTLSLRAAPSSISVDSQAITVGLSTEIDAVGSTYTQALPGGLRMDPAPPSWSRVNGVGVGLSVDMMNQLFYAVQGAGLLEQEVDGAEFGLNPADLDFLFPGLTSLYLVLESSLPPTVVPGTGPDDLEAQVGSLRVTLLDGPGSVTPMVEAYLSATANVDLSFTGSTVTPSVGAASVWVDVLHPADIGDPLEVVIEGLVPTLLPLITDFLTEIEIPAFEGFSITVSSAALDGPDDGYYTLAGELIEVP